MTAYYREGCGQYDPQSEKEDQPDSDHAFVVIPLILATFAFFAASEGFRVGRKISVIRKDAFHWAVALSRKSQPARPRKAVRILGLAEVAHVMTC